LGKLVGKLSKRLAKLMPWRFTPIGITHLAVVRRSGLQVMTGPFKGMKYVSNAHGSCLPPKLLGCYERELHPVLKEYQAKPLDLVIDIGAAEGYYAVGVVFSGVAKRSIAYEAMPAGAKLLREVARSNGVEAHVAVKGFCKPEDLQDELTAADTGRTLVIIDAEGAEDLLLDPARVPATKNASILVELHDFIIPGVTERIQERFRETHTITRYDQQNRSLDENLCQTWLVRRLPRKYPLEILCEKRLIPMHWFWMRPKPK
jgi:predicted RNA methylase